MQSIALCSTLLKVSCRLSATRPDAFYSNPFTRSRSLSHAIRFFSSTYRRGRDTILQNVGQRPACTCWSLLSPSSSVTVRLKNATRSVLSCLSSTTIILMSIGFEYCLFEGSKSQITVGENATRCAPGYSSSHPATRWW